MQPVNIICVSLPRSASTFTASLIRQNYECYIQSETFKPVRPEESKEYIETYLDKNTMTFTKYVSIVNIRQAAYMFRPVNQMLNESHSFSITPRSDYVDHYMSLLLNVYYDLFNPLTDVKMSSVYSSGAEKRNKALTDFFCNKEIDIDIIDSLMYSLAHNINVIQPLIESTTKFSYNEVIQQSDRFLNYLQCEPHAQPSKFKQTTYEEKLKLVSKKDFNMICDLIRSHVKFWYKEDGSPYEF